MAIDSGIYQLAGRGVKSVADYDNEAAQAQQNKLALMMGGMKMDEAKRGIADQNTLRGVYAQFGEDSAANTNALYKAGLGQQASAYAKSAQDMAKDKADTQKTQMANTMQKLALGSQLLGGVTDQASYDAARQTAQASGLDVSRMPPAYDPAFVAQKLKEGQTVKEQLDQHWKAMEYSTPNANAVLSAKTSTDNNNNSNATSRANNSASVGATMRGQDITAGTAAAGRAQSASQHSQTLAQGGKPPAGYRFTADGNMQAIPGGPADLKINAAGVTKVNDAKDVLGLLDEVDKLLPKATGSYLGAGVDALAGGVGIGTQGAASSAQLKAIEGALISKMPKMSGPQSDKDVLLYRQMAGQVGDQTIPTKQRQAAADMVRKLHEKYAGMPEGASRATTNLDSLLDKYK